jgi:hypothetical protein
LVWASIPIDLITWSPLLIIFPISSNEKEVVGMVLDDAVASFWDEKGFRNGGEH